MVEVDGSVVAEIGPGAVVGERAALHERHADGHACGPARRGASRACRATSSTRRRWAPSRRPTTAGSRGSPSATHVGRLPVSASVPSTAVIDWLLDADPAIRWQVMRDLTHEPADVIAAERSRVATEGWGARLLALQAPDGLWAGNAFSQDRTDTFHVLELLRRLGLDPESEQARRAVGLVREHVTWGDGAWWNPPWADNRFFEGEVEPCINGNVVATGSYFGVDMTPLVERLLGEQLADGGWNCEVENGATVSSFGTTINVLEGLLEHERAIGGSAEVARGPPPRRGVHARAPAVPSEVDRRGDRPRLAPVLVPDLVALRRPARARLPARRRGRRPTSASPRRSGSSRATGIPTAGGRSRTSTRARSTSRWRTARASRAAGTRSARCACSTGSRRAGRRPHGSQVSRRRLAFGDPGELLELTAKAALVRSAREDP